MTSFVNIELATEASQLEEEYLETLTELVETKYPGWEPHDADLEVIVGGAIAQTMASLLASIASSVPPAIFRQFGTQLVKILYNEGASATAATTWTVVPSGSPRTIPAGTTLEAGGLAFFTEKDTTVAPSVSSVSIIVTAAERGTEYNNISGVALQVNPINFVTEVQIVGESSGGVAQETDEEYENRLVGALALQAPRPITASDYAAFVLDVPSSVLPAGVVVGRATAIDGYKEGTVEPEATVTSGSTELKEITSETGFTPGGEVVATGVPVGTVLVSKTKAGEWKMSEKGTSTPGKKAIKIVGTFENQRTVTTFVTDKQGHALTTEAMEAIEKWLAGYREINFLAYVKAPTITKVYVTAKVHVLPGYEAATVEANIKTALESFLSPELWGNPSRSETGSNQWLNYVNGVHVYGTVRYNQLIGVIEAVPGVAYVFAGSEGLKTGFSATPTGTTDLVLPGPAPLPEATEATIVVTNG